MSLSHDRVTDVAGIMVSLSNDMNRMWAKVHAALEYNSDLAIDWSADVTPDYITEDADGNLEGMNIDRASVSNVIGSLDQFRNLMTNRAVSQGDHLGNFHTIGRPITIR